MVSTHYKICNNIWYNYCLIFFLTIKRRGANFLKIHSLERFFQNRPNVLEAKMRKLKGFCFIIIIVVSFCFAISPLIAQEKKDSEDTYLIKKGDTLWDISSKFMKNPYLWPKVWQMNPYIANPHWIYPGQTIRLVPGEARKQEEGPKVQTQTQAQAQAEEKPALTAPPAVEAQRVEPAPVEKRAEKQEQPAVAEKKEPVREEIAPKEKTWNFPEKRYAGFFSDIEYHGVGMVLDNREGKVIMAEGDIIYIAFKVSEPVSIGNKYTVFRASDLILHPVTEKKIGRKYNVMGNIQIIDQNGNFCTAKVIEAFDAIYKGDYVRNYTE
jgi:hypothetical protein